MVPKLNSLFHLTLTPIVFLKKMVFENELINHHIMSSTESCLICREAGPDSRTRCSHFYHTGCLQAWFDEGHYTCPLCRTPISGKALVEDFFAGKVSEEEILNLDYNDFTTKDFLRYYIFSKNEKSSPELILKMIRERGLNVNLKMDEESTLFEISCGAFGLETIKLIIKLGANLRLGGGRNALSFGHCRVSHR